jgi:hypothetical protein
LSTEEVRKYFANKRKQSEVLAWKLDGHALL